MRKCKLLFFIACEDVTALGMEDGVILDSQVSASSNNSLSTSPPFARLNSPLGSWVALSSDLHPWLQVDFLKHAKVIGIITQGQASSYFVGTFTVSFGNNNEDFQQYKEFERVKVL